MDERRSRRRARSAGGVLAVVVSLAAIPAATATATAAAADPPLERRILDLEPRVLDIEPRVLDIGARVLSVESRIVDVAEAEDGTTEIPVPSDVLFAFASAELTPAAARQLDGVVERIRQAQPGRVRIEGHTDAIGEDASNQRLSEQRAEAVRSYLAGRSGSPSAYEAQGFGETKPVAPNERPDGTDDPAGRQGNRRVTVVLDG